MSKGSLELIKLLTIVTFFVILLVGFILLISGLSEEEGVLPAFWDSFSTIINAWMPSSDEGGIGYLILMAVAALIGLLVTSVLIGIISSGIEEKIISLRRGNSRVLEKGHIVVIGFYPGEYTLLQQLVLAAGSEPCCIVVAGEMERDEMEQYIRDNIDIPKNVRIICRMADIFDPMTLERCSLSECRSVIISPTDDERTVKALLSVSQIVNRSGKEDVRVGAIVSRKEYSIPPTVARKHNVTSLQTDETLAKIVAHSCTQPGLSATFREIFNFEGSEMYRVHLPGSGGLSFGELFLHLDRAVPIGLFQNGKLTMFPERNCPVREEDDILVFAENRDSAQILPAVPEVEIPAFSAEELPEEPVGTIVIIGKNGSLPTLLNELPEGSGRVILAGDVDREEMLRSLNRTDLELTVDRRNLNRAGELEDLVRTASHVVVLSDDTLDDPEEADMASIFRILNLRDIRERKDLDFNITSEMHLERNQTLIASDDNTDFIVASNMVALFLAQLAENPELFAAFSEILSNEGNELYLKKAESLHCEGTGSILRLRKLLLEQEYLFLGYLKESDHVSHFNPGLLETVSLEAGDSVIVLGEK